MYDWRELVAKIVGVVVASGVGLLLVVLAAEVLLPRLAHAATLFVATPGGIILLIVAWRYMSRKRSH